MVLLILIGVAGVALVAAGNLLLVSARDRPAAVPVADVTRTATGAAAGAAWIPPASWEGTASRRTARHQRWAGRVLRRPPAGMVLWFVCSTFYAAVGAYLVIHAGSIVGDAESRVADGFYVLFSRDPHVAAVGFVWNPLPSFAAMPFFALKGIFPVMTERAYAGSLMSALFMAGAVVQVRGAVREAGAPKVLRWVLVGAFALNPMVVYYGANGMSEAPYVFFLAVCVRYLARWVLTGRLTPLVWSGIGLGACYLARYEAAVAAVGATLVVLGVSWWRAQGPTRRRTWIALSDGAVFVIPFVAAFVGWALTSKVITGSAFEYLTSQYGNTSQVKTVGVDNLPGHGTGLPLPVFVGLQMLSFAPLLPVLVVAGVLHARRSRDLRILVPILALGTIAAFIFLTFVSGTTFGWLRLHLPSAVMATLCIAYLFSPPTRSVGIPASPARPTRAGAASRPKPSTAGRKAGSGIVLGCLLALVAIPTTAWAMTDHRLGVGEVPQLRWVLQKDAAMSEGDRNTKAIVTSSGAIAAQIDAMHLPPGSVVADTFTPCVSSMLMHSDHPHQFVITSDRDFQPVLADPATFKAHYLLIPPPEGYGGLDALTRAYPNLYRQGAKGAELVRTFDEPGCPQLRLYQVLGA